MMKIVHTITSPRYLVNKGMLRGFSSARVQNIKQSPLIDKLASADNTIHDFIVNTLAGRFVYNLLVIMSFMWLLVFIGKK